jgi:pimeloyl-ACP methyl ester carboxylesterase
MRFSITLLFLFILQIVFSQQPNDWGAFKQVIDAKPYAGKKFKLEAVVKTQMIDKTSEAEIWFRVEKTNKKMGFYFDTRETPVTQNEWTPVTIEGLIDKDAEFLSFGGLYYRQGIFFFDDFKFLIEINNDIYEEIEVKNGGFEAETHLSNWMYFRDQKGFTLSVTSETAHFGKNACKVDGSQFKNENTIGNNELVGKYIEVNNVKLYYEEYGKGEPLLLLHGNSESIESFDLQVMEFAKKYRVIAVDTRGQGKSSEDGKLYTYDLFAEDMNLFMDALKIKSAHIVGWSDGGNTGLIMAMKYPKKVKKLVSMGANVFIDDSVVESWIFNELNSQLTQLSSDTSYEAENRSRLIKLLLTEPKHSFEELKSIACPVLVMAGENDVIKENHTKAIANAIKKATLLIVPNETHYFPKDNASDFNAKVLDFLD